MNTTCIVLAGGLGTRLKPIVNDLPKCLAPVGNKPFIYHQMKQLQLQGIEKFILALGYKAQMVKKEISTWNTDMFAIDFSEEDEPLGTGGALLKAMTKFNLSEAIAINGDTYIRGNIDSMLDPLAIESREYIRIATTHIENAARYGSIETNQKGQVTQFLEKGRSKNGEVSCGVYRIHLKAFMHHRQKPFSLEQDIFPMNCSLGTIFAQSLDAEFIDIGVPDDYLRFCKLQNLA